MHKKITMAINNSFQLLILFSLLSTFLSLQHNTFNPNSTTLNVVGCIEMERKTLLEFKAALEDPSGKLSSWVGEKCCKWKGITCNNQMGNVVKLDLRNNDCFMEKFAQPQASNSSCLGGVVSPSLLDLKYLSYLDLSLNNFQYSPIPKFLGSLENLSYLNLSYSSFAGGMIPPHLGNLSNLRYLDLYAVSFPFGYNLSWVSNLNWLSGLISLKYLDLGGVNLSLTTNNWFQPLNMLSSLTELHLSNCELDNFIHSLPALNFTSLEVLDLSYNQFDSSIPQWLFNITSLVKLDLTYCSVNSLGSYLSWEYFCNFQTLRLSNNKIKDDVGELIEGLSQCSNNSLEVLELSWNLLSGQLPDSLGQFKNLISLEISHNLISGPIPVCIGKLLSLEELYVSYNEMNGSIPENVGKLQELKTLDLDQNYWEGVFSQNHFQRLKKLETFHLSSFQNSFTFNVSREWVPPFSVTTLYISSCPLGPKFPSWLSTQKQLSFLFLRDVAISDTIPDWLWKLSPQMQYLDLSGNQIGGTLPISLDFSPRAWMDLSYNKLQGPVPLWPNVSALILANNSLSGSIPMNIGQVMPSLVLLDLSGNFLHGTIPLSISKMNDLLILDLSNNRLSGKIHNQWIDSQQIGIIDLSGNDLSGNIPSSMCSLPSLYYLKLSHNSFSGELSFSLQNCTRLSTLDLGENKITGIIPKWIGENLVLLSRIRFRNNRFTGVIPEQLCSLPNLHILDIALNNLSGSIPRCLGNLTALSSLTSYTPYFRSGRYMYIPNLDLSVKGTQMTYTNTLALVNVIDLSNNGLSGKIPEEITRLLTLRVLNLSRNQLIGKIPGNIGGLQDLETLDLSSNHLSGSIPQSMVSIISLNHLNLSHNNLSGPIPLTNQFHTFNDPSNYEGNPELCGPPLLASCSSIPTDGNAETKDEKDDEDDKFEKLWFYISVGLGFIFGFWGVCGSLVIKKSWRDAYFQFLEQIKDRLFMVIAINIRHLQRMMKI